MRSRHAAKRSVTFGTHAHTSFASTSSLNSPAQRPRPFSSRWPPLTQNSEVQAWAGHLRHERGLHLLRSKLQLIGMLGDRDDKDALLEAVASTLV